MKALRIASTLIANLTAADVVLAQSSKSGITRRLVRVIFLQLLFISLITVLGVVVAAKVFEKVTMRTALEGEAKHFWDLLQINPDHGVPNTDNLRGYLVPALSPDDSAIDAPPTVLLDAEPGYGRFNVNGSEVLVLIESREVRGQSRTLYLVFDEESVAALSFYFGVVPLSLVLIMIYLAGYVGFRHTRAAISPVVALANRLRSFHSKPNQLIDLNLDDLQTASAEDEVTVLVNSLKQFTDEINEVLGRERRFTRDASHELRTPLAVIQGSAEFLESTVEAGPNQRRTIERILRTVRDMNELVNALLILARGNNQLPAMSTVSINQVVDKLLGQLQSTHNRDNHVATEVVERADSTVIASPQLVEAVVGNLLRNAFNYTRQGDIRVVIEESAIEVSNYGEGVQAIDVETIFEPFSRGENTDTEGFGVGLDIVKRLCELFGWKIAGRHCPDHGMVFRVEFQ